MTRPSPTRSFAPDDRDTVTSISGAVAQSAYVEHTQLLERRFHHVRQGVWSLVGNGLSNQTFIDAPEGIIAIDTGESVEEMRAALAELRAVTDRPVVAVLYTHFHYVGGTRAILDERGLDASGLPIHGHARIAFNRTRAAAEIGTAYGRGLIEQFAISLPVDGPDSCPNVGLGLYYRDPAHAPFTPGHVPVNRTFDGACELQVAGLTVHVQPAPSDADDSVTYWFPELGTAVNNLVWPVLFNVFAIRGEEYRDPRIMLHGIDHLLSLHADHLVAAHGPPINGADTIEQRVTRYRDSIQFLWDQTVRLTNRGLSSVELGHAIRLPDQCDDDYLTSEFYGVAEHHVRQIRHGLFGFFDGDEANLFPHNTAERAARLIAGFGGRGEVRRQLRAAIDTDDMRWALELGSWLVRSDDAEPTDRELLATALRQVARRTSAANIRSWCLTRALSLEGRLDLSRTRTHRLPTRQVIADPVQSVHTLRVLLLPERADGIDLHIRWEFDGGRATGLHIRNSVAVPTDGTGAAAVLRCTGAAWAAVLGGQAAWPGDLAIEGDAAAVRRALAVFDVESLQP